MLSCPHCYRVYEAPDPEPIEKKEEEPASEEDTDAIPAQLRD